jgi:hypothetical protein|tara:strand:+ start:5353 stop:5970 length:618 start_codon:yes stop_codon:yes gene_type:complete
MAGFIGAGTKSLDFTAGDVDGNFAVGGNIDLEGSIDVNGTTNLDVVDIDGAVDMASTLAVAGVITATAGAILNGTTSIEEVIEKVTTATSTTGTINFDALTSAVQYYTANQSANRTINFRASSGATLNSIMATGESMSFAILLAQGSTAYYLNTYQVDGSAVTPKWQGGSAPDAGNASSTDSYNFTIVKTADATFVVFASLTQFA